MLSQTNNDELQPTADSAAAERGRWVEWNRWIFHLMPVVCRHPVLTDRTDLSFQLKSSQQRA